ncbi:MAG TPA: TetR/AcrR family transcriptional regulator [Solirubrobacterales bacterium]|nr:TetR/AcrR family transcriptional regulator [Solirubrobacterales bacterium]
MSPALAPEGPVGGDSPLFDRLRPGPGQSRSDVVTSQRDRLQRALIEIAAVGGYEAVTVRKLTKLARVSTGAFYAQFNGTDDCLMSAYGRLMRAAGERIEAARSPRKASPEQCGNSVAALLSSLVDNPVAGRLALFEIFRAGPVAVSSAHTQETELELALRQSLDRRGRRVAPAAVAWITSGLLYCARGALGTGDDISPASLRRLVAWGQACLAEPPEDIRRGRLRLDWSRRERPAECGPASESPGNETELILSAVLRVATANGYQGVSPSGTSKAAGVPIARFKRYFADADDAYLTALSRAANDLFLGFGRQGEEPGRPWTVALCEQIAALCDSVAEDPELADLVFGRMLDPGLVGLTCRESLIREIASSWRLSVPLPERPAAMIAEASMAALWNSIARTVAVGQASRLPERAAASSYRFLAPVIGGDRAAAIVAGEFGGRSRRTPQEAAFGGDLQADQNRMADRLLH